MRIAFHPCSAVLAAALVLTACGNSAGVADERSSPGPALTPTQPQDLDRSCDLAAFPSIEWTDCEAANFARTGVAAQEQLGADFVMRMEQQSLLNIQQWMARALDDPSWLDPLSGNTALLPLCATWGEQCVGDPFRYPDAPGPDGATFYRQEAEVTPVLFYDRDCTRLSGRVWLPGGTAPGTRLPNIVFANGSVQAPEPLYWFIVQPLVKAGYAVLTYDPRGQGRSDQQAPGAQQGSNLELEIFWNEQVDAIDFLRSTPERPYPHNLACAGTYPTPTTPFNPIWDRIDLDRLGITGHSAGAIATSVVQGYGAPGADPWPGLMDGSNPVKAAVALDSLVVSDGQGLAPVDDYGFPPAVYDALILLLAQGNLPDSVPRVPALSFNADYGFAPAPYASAPDADAHKRAFAAWQAAGIPAYVIGFQGSTHFDYSQVPTFPATSWCPETSIGACRGGWAAPAIVHYTLAWFDRWLKRPGERGYDDADRRLIDDAGPQGAAKFSFRFRSARDYPDRSGKRQRCEDLRAGCS